jgi:hypothetical protein
MKKLNNEQIKLSAQFISNLGLLFIAGVLSPLFSNNQDVNIILVIPGLILSLVCLISSLYIVRGVKK